MRQALAPVLVVSAILAGPPTAARAQTADQVVARYVQARGGAAKIRAVQTLRLTGKMTLPGVEAPLVLELKRPNRMRTEFVFQGKTGVRAFDGRNAWMILPVLGMDQPQPMPPEDARDAREQADIDLSPLIDPQAKGFAVELMGRESALGQESFKVQVRSREGQVRTLYLDAKSYLVTRIEETRQIEGKGEEFETLVGDYRTVAGLVFPHLIELGPRRGDERQKLIFDRIEVNVPIDDARFAAPAAAAR
jgi:hypothetical protein